MTKVEKSSGIPVFGFLTIKPDACPLSASFTFELDPKLILSLSIL